MRHRRRPRMALQALAGTCLVVLTAGCAAAGPEGSGPSDALVGERPAAAAPSAPAPAGALATSPPPAPVDPAAPASYRPAVRPGRAAPHLRAAAGRLVAGAPVRYPDGLQVVLERVARAVEQAQGPGAFPGRPLTVLTLAVTNGSTRPLDLSQVVVTTTYGARPRTAAPVYDVAGARDFSGTLAPGGTARATYAFAVPPRRAQRVSTVVDLDSAHTAAVFTGAVR